MKKTIISTVLLCGTLFCTTSINAQKMDSTATAMLNGWVTKYKLNNAESKQIKPYILSEQVVLNKLGKLQPSTINDSLINFQEVAYTDTINNVLILDGHYNIESSRFTNALKYSKRLNLTPVQISALAANNLTLDRLTSTFVPTESEETFNSKPYTESYFPPIFTPAQYDTILYIEAQPKAVAKAKKSFQQLKTNNLLGNNDSAKVMNDMVNYLTIWFYTIKKQETSKTSMKDFKDAQKLLSITKPILLQQLDMKLNPKKKPTDPTLLVAYDSLKNSKLIDKEVQNKLSIITKKNKINDTTKQTILPLLYESVSKQNSINKLNIPKATKDSLKKDIKSDYDSKIAAYVESQNQWKQLKKYKLTATIDSIATISTLYTYNLQTYILSKKLNEDPTNDSLKASKKTFVNGKPSILKKLSLAMRTASKGSTGNYLW